MELYKVTFEVDGRNLQCILREGVIASVETGKIENKIEKPVNRACIIVSRGQQGKPVAWVQVSKLNGQTFSITGEGWIDSTNSRSTYTSARVIRGKLEAVAEPDENSVGCAQKAEFGILNNCCTSNGNGCYVKCCGGCCSDPVGCPGASCCP